MATTGAIAMHEPPGERPGRSIASEGDHMFRQEEVFIGGWQEKTVEAMQRRRFE